jgi:hypothetical protein
VVVVYRRYIADGVTHRVSVGFNNMAGIRHLLTSACIPSHHTTTSSEHSPGTSNNTSRRAHGSHVVSHVSGNRCFILSYWTPARWLAGSLGG